MKLVVMMYLADDDERVESLLERKGITAFSRMSLEGHGKGKAGWYGDVAPYESSMIIAALDDESAQRLADEIGQCVGCEDPAHPVHAYVLDVERAVSSGSLATPST